jgi:hypothetical protein
LGFHLVFPPAQLTFCLGALFLQEKECNLIQGPALRATLSKLHLNRNTARAIIFGPQRYGGLNLPNLYTSQGIRQLTLLIGHIRIGDDTGSLMLIDLSHLQLQVGSSTLFLSLPYHKNVKWIDSGWLPSIWQFLNRAQLKIFIRKAYIPRTQRVHDIALMDFFLSLKYLPAVLRILNACRLYLQVIIVSDITTASGEEIEDDIKRGRQMIDRESRLHWPTQQRPPRQAWKQWQEALKYLGNGPKLKQPLGDWTTASHQKWKWFLHQEDNELYKLSSDGWEQYPKYQRNEYRNTRASSRVKYSNFSSIIQPPTGTLLPASIMRGGAISTTGIKITHSENPFPPAVEPQVQHHLENRGGKLTPHPYYKNLLDQMENLMMERLPEIGDAIRYNDLYVCSDGAHNHSNRLGSHAWVFSTAAGEVLWCGAGPTIGHATMTSPGRSELSGITALLLLHWGTTPPPYCTVFPHIACNMGITKRGLLVFVMCKMGICFFVVDSGAFCQYGVTFPVLHFCFDLQDGGALYMLQYGFFLHGNMGTVSDLMQYGDFFPHKHAIW